MKKIKRLLAFLLVFTMIFGNTTTNVVAEENNSTVTENVNEVDESKIEDTKDDETIDVTSDEKVVSGVTPKIKSGNVPLTTTSYADTKGVSEELTETYSVEVIREPRDTSSDGFYRIFHLDAGRKYFSVENIKAYIDTMAAAGYNQFQLYLSDTEGFRFALNDMKVTTLYGEYDLGKALGDGISSDSWKQPDGSDKYLTETDMDEIITYASGKGIELVPSINTPGHMGAILNSFPEFGYGSSTVTSIDLANEKAVAFALGIVEKYATYFESKGIEFFNIGADEYDLQGGGFATLYENGNYSKFVDYVNSAANVVINHGMTPRVFNDGIYYNEDTTTKFNSAIQVCYWSKENGYASSEFIRNQGLDLINANGNYYWALGSGYFDVTAEEAAQFDYTVFQDGITISNPAGAMFCVWCDRGDWNGADDGNGVVSATSSIVTAFGNTLPKVLDTTVTNEEKTVSVTGPGLTGVTAGIVDNATAIPEDAEEGSVITYDIVPTTASGKYTGRAVVVIDVPDEWDDDQVYGFVVNDDGTITNEISGTHDKENNTFSFTVPHFSNAGAYVRDASYIEEKTINMVVGQTYDIALESADVTVGTVKDSNVAIVSEIVTGDARTYREVSTVVSEGKYIIANTSTSGLGVLTTNYQEGGYNNSWNYANGMLLSKEAKVSDGVIYGSAVSDANLWTITEDTSNEGYYFIQTSDGKCLTIDKNNVQLSSTSTSLKINEVNNGFNISNASKICLNNFGGACTFASGYDQENAVNEWWQLYKADSEYGVTITAKTVGTTEVVIGDTRYVINVVAEDLSNVETFKIQLWNTNAGVDVDGVTKDSNSYFTKLGTGTTEKAKYVEIHASDVGINTEQGVALTELVPQGIKDGVVATSDDIDASMVYWRGVVLTEGIQYYWAESMVNEGTVFTHVRYLDTRWQVYVPNNDEWISVNSSIELSNDQVIAYYMTRTRVTEHAQTDVVDWGNVLSETSSVGDRYVILDYAVKYPGGTIVPEKFAQDGKTQFFHCNGGTSEKDKDYLGTEAYRYVNYIYGRDTSTYEVYMITVTPTQDYIEGQTTTFTSQLAPTQYSYTGTERVIWAESTDVIPDGYARVDDEDFIDKVFYDSIGGVQIGGEASISRLKIYNLEGLLVTYYVRGVESSDSLQVQYIDDTTGLCFHTINIPVINNGETIKTFLNNLMDNRGTPTDESDDVVYNVSMGEQLADNRYYITDRFDVDVKIRTDLKEIINLQGVYSTGIYEHVLAEVDSDNPKILKLHYTVDSMSAQPNFIVDFGLPVSVKATDLYENAENIISFTKKSDGQYGTISCDGTEVTYTLKADTVLSTLDRVKVDVTYKDGSTQEQSIYFTPATTVYYEEGFATYSGTWSSEGNQGIGKQATEPDEKNTHVYGYDPKYADEFTGPSNNSQATSVTAGTTATFEFTGNGVEVYTNNTPTTGNLMAKLYALDNSGNATLKSMYIVQTAMLNGKEEGTQGQKVSAYNVPIISIRDLAQGNYRLVIQHLKQSGKETPGAINIDGFRVIGAIGLDRQIYTDNGEVNPTFIELRDHVLMTYLYADSSSSEKYANQIAGNIMSQVYAYDSDATTFKALVLDGTNIGTTTDNIAAEDAVVKDLVDNGPKNEIYLQPKQQLVFKINATNAQIGMKALNASTKYTIKKDIEEVASDVDITSSTDMYYSLSPSGETTYTVTNDGDGILAITMLKVFGATELTPVTVEDVELLMVSWGFRASAVEPELPEVPEVPEDDEENKIPESVVKPENTTKPGFSTMTEGTKSETEDTKETGSSSLSTKIVKVEVADSEETSKVVQKENNMVPSEEDKTSESEEVPESETTVEEDGVSETETDIQETENLETEKAEESSINPVLLIGIVVAILAVAATMIFGFKKNKKK